MLDSVKPRKNGWNNYIVWGDQPSFGINEQIDSGGGSPVVAVKLLSDDPL